MNILDQNRNGSKKRRMRDEDPGVDDVVLDESEEQRKREEVEEFEEMKTTCSTTSCEQEGTEHKMTQLSFRSSCRHLHQTRGRTAVKHLMKKRQVPQIHVDEKEG